MFDVDSFDTLYSRTIVMMYLSGPLYRVFLKFGQIKYQIHIQENNTLFKKLKNEGPSHHLNLFVNF